MSFDGLPLEERPRERLLRLGAGALSLPELLAILLRTGSGDRDVLDLARGLIARFSPSDAPGGLEGLFRATPQELLEVPGMGPAKVATLLTAFELVRRLATNERASTSELPAWKDRVSWWARMLATEEREYIVALFVDRRGGFLGEEKVSYGGLSGAFLDFSFLFRRALRVGAAGLVLLHNHPDGSLSESAEDRSLTSSLDRKLRLLDMELIEHFIVAKGSFRPMGKGSDF